MSRDNLPEQSRGRPAAQRPAGGGVERAQAGPTDPDRAHRRVRTVEPQARRRAAAADAATGRRAVTDLAWAGRAADGRAATRAHAGDAGHSRQPSAGGPAAPADTVPRVAGRP